MKQAGAVVLNLSVQFKKTFIVNSIVHGTVKEYDIHYVIDTTDVGISLQNIKIIHISLEVKDQVTEQV